MAPKSENKKHTVLSLNKRITALEETVGELQAKLEGIKGVVVYETPEVVKKNLAKPEAHDKDGLLPEVKESEFVKRLSPKMQFQSVANCVRILNPNLCDDNGRHTAENVSRIVGFSKERTAIILEEYYEKYPPQ